MFLFPTLYYTLRLRSSVQDWELLLFPGPKMVPGIIPEQAWSYKKTKKLVLVHRAPNNNQWLVTSHFSVSPAIPRFTSKYILFCLQKILFEITWNIYMAFLYRKKYKKTLHTFKYNFWNTLFFTREILEQTPAFGYFFNWDSLKARLTSH